MVKTNGEAAKIGIGTTNVDKIGNNDKPENLATETIKTYRGMGIEVIYQMVKEEDYVSAFKALQQFILANGEALKLQMFIVENGKPEKWSGYQFGYNNPTIIRSTTQLEQMANNFEEGDDKRELLGIVDKLAGVERYAMIVGASHLDREQETVNATEYRRQYEGLVHDFNLWMVGRVWLRDGIKDNWRELAVKQVGAKIDSVVVLMDDLMTKAERGYFVRAYGLDRVMEEKDSYLPDGGPFSTIPSTNLQPDLF